MIANLSSHYQEVDRLRGKVEEVLSNHSKTMARLEERIVSNNSSISNIYRTSSADIPYIHRKLSELEVKGINIFVSLHNT